jgi:methylamine---corrinoid protein Co-methyltransferase
MGPWTKNSGRLSKKSKSEQASKGRFHMVPFWEVMDRALHSGPLTKPGEFEKRLFKKTMDLARKYEIRYVPETPIVNDDAMISRLFAAGIELYAELGTYCLDTQRVIRFDEAEIRQELNECAGLPPEILVGTGYETRRLPQRKVGDRTPPLVIGAFIEDSPNEGRDFVQLYKSVAQEPVIDGLYFGPAPRTIEGRTYLLNSPLDIQAVKSAVWWIREALRSVGKPGLHLLEAGCSAVASIAATADENGLRKTDAFVIPTISEMKVDYEILNKVAHSISHGIIRHSYWSIIIGGYAGGPAGAAIVGIASALNAIMVYKSRYCYVSTIQMNPPINSARNTLWVKNVCIQCLSRHTHMICGGGGGTAAGPGTEQQLLEIAALAIANSIAGGHIFHGFRKNTGLKPNQASGMEPRWGGETAKAAVSLSLEQANEVVLYLLSRYEDSLSTEKAPEGYCFHELYDTEKVTVRPDYLRLYDKVKADLAKRGINYPGS